MPAAAQVTHNEHHLNYESQIAIGPGAWDERIDVLNRGYPVWEGVLEILRTDDEALALAIEAWLSAFEGRANWSWLPTHRPKAPAQMTVSGTGTGTDGALYHTVSSVSGELATGQRLRAGRKMYSVRTVDRARSRLVLDPQRPVSGTLEPAASVAARLIEAEHPPMPRGARIWGPWSLAWREL